MVPFGLNFSRLDPISTKQYPGSSGYWADGSQGSRPGLGYPGDMARAQLASQLGFASPNPTVNFTGGVKSAFGPAGLFNAGPAAGGAGQAPNFATLNNVKSGPIQSSIDGLLAQINGMGPNNQYNLHSNVHNAAIESALQSMLGNLNAYTAPRDFTKSGAFQSGINSGYGQANADNNTNRNQFANFAQLFEANTPGLTDTVNQENSAIGSYYDTGPGGVQGQLDKIAGDRAHAVNLSANRALDRVARNNALLRMGRGDSSYATQQALDTSAAIYADEARQKAELDRNNLMYVKDSQAKLAGLRNQGTNSLVNRQLQPIDALTHLGAASDARLFGLGSADLSNNVYTTPQEQGAQRLALLSGLSNASAGNNTYTLDSSQQNLAQQLGLLGQLSGINNANNFYGLSKPYEPDTSGYGAGGAANYGNYGGSHPANVGGYTSGPFQNYYQPPPALAAGGGGVGGTTYAGGQPRDAAQQAYFAQTGKYPNTDPNFNMGLWSSLLNSTGTSYYNPAPVRPQMTAASGLSSSIPRVFSVV